MPLDLFILSIFVNIGMWFERFVIVASSLHRDFLPSSWVFCLFLRFLPMVATAEVKTVMPQADPHHGDDRAAPERTMVSLEEEPTY